VSLQVGVFDFGSRSSPLVLLLDRNDDPVTPLLTQWTYQVSLLAGLGTGLTRNCKAMRFLVAVRHPALLKSGTLHKVWCMGALKTVCCTVLAALCCAGYDP
jgi:hypothetical protein